MYPLRVPSIPLLVVAVIVMAQTTLAELNPCTSTKIRDIWNGEEEDIFGFAVAVFGETTVIGIPGDDLAGVRSGSVYVFWNDGLGGLVLQAILYPPDTDDLDHFGYSVAIVDDVIVVGAPDDDDNGNSSGAAYVFRYSGSSWVFEDKLLPIAGEPQDMFGHSVALSGDLVVVGEPQHGDNIGSIYIFRRFAGDWVTVGRFAASGLDGADRFGQSVAISGTAVLIAMVMMTRGNGPVRRTHGTSRIQTETAWATAVICAPIRRRDSSSPQMVAR